MESEMQECVSMCQEFLNQYYALAHRLRQFEDLCQTFDEALREFKQTRQHFVESRRDAAAQGMKCSTLCAECFSTEDDWRRFLNISRESFVAKVKQLMESPRVFEFNEEDESIDPFSELELWPDGDEPVKYD